MAEEGKLEVGTEGGQKNFFLYKRHFNDCMRAGRAKYVCKGIALNMLRWDEDNSLGGPDVNHSKGFDKEA